MMASAISATTSVASMEEFRFAEELGFEDMDNSGDWIRESAALSSPRLVSGHAAAPLAIGNTPLRQRRLSSTRFMQPLLPIPETYHAPPSPLPPPVEAGHGQGGTSSSPSKSAEEEEELERLAKILVQFAKSLTGHTAGGTSGSPPMGAGPVADHSEESSPPYMDVSSWTGMGIRTAKAIPPSQGLGITNKVDACTQVSPVMRRGPFPSCVTSGAALKDFVTPTLAPPPVCSPTNTDDPMTTEHSPPLLARPWTPPLVDSPIAPMTPERAIRRLPYPPPRRDPKTLPAPSRRYNMSPPQVPPKSSTRLCHRPKGSSAIPARKQSLTARSAMSAVLGPPTARKLVYLVTTT